MRTVCARVQSGERVMMHQMHARPNIFERGHQKNAKTRLLLGYVKDPR